MKSSTHPHIVLLSPSLAHELSILIMSTSSSLPLPSKHFSLDSLSFPSHHQTVLTKVTDNLYVIQSNESFPFLHLLDFSTTFKKC